MQENPDLWAQYLANERTRERADAEEAFQRDAYYLRQELARRYADRGNEVARRLLARPRGYFPTHLEVVP